MSSERSESRSPRGYRARLRRSLVASRVRPALVGSASVVGCLRFNSARCRARPRHRYLSFAECEKIALLTAKGFGVRVIARQLDRSPSTISRKLRRNAATRGGRLKCRAGIGQWKADLQARRPKVSKLAANDRLSGQIGRPDGQIPPGPEVKFVSRRHGRRADRRGALSRSRTGSGSTALAMSPFRSHTRPSTRPSTSRAAVP
jgi:hypothetical protein